VYLLDFVLKVYEDHDEGGEEYHDRRWRI